jgi:hypothetical protein
MYKRLEYYIVKYGRHFIGIGLILFSVYLYQVQMKMW